MMERALKERIVGAAILVLFVVLVVPIFLDGPPPPTETVSHRLMLPGQDEQKTQTVVLDRNRKEPVPAASGADNSVKAVAPKPKVVPQVQREVAESVPTPEQKPEPRDDVPQKAKPAVEAPPVSATGLWAVQLGSFSNKPNAEKLAAELRKQGYAAFLSQLATDSGQLHRVRVGPQKDRDSAEAMAARLLQAGHKGQVVVHP